MDSDELASYVDPWRDAYPQRAIAWRFERPDERIRFGALGALQFEWWKALHEIREPQVVATKLGWWREEVERAARGEAHHPLTRALFADERIRRVPLPLWTAAVEAALLAVDPPPAVDFAAQRTAATPLAEAFAVLETRAAFGAGASSDKAFVVTTLGHLTANLRALAIEVGHGRSPLPMNLLARHGLRTEELARDGPARRTALRDYMGELEPTLADAVIMQGPLTLFRRVEMQRDLEALRAGRRAEDPLRSLLERRGGFRNLLKIWRSARISRQDQAHEGTDATA